MGHGRAGLRVNSSHTMADRGADFYRTCEPAILAFISIERAHLPSKIWEPCCGDGAIVQPLLKAGYRVVATDLLDRGAGYAAGYDYLHTPPPGGTEAIVTNPPFSLASEMVAKAIGEVPYHAWLLPLGFLESARRLPMFRANPPARVWVSSRRLPMMHRDGWSGPEAGSNKCHAWFVWDAADMFKGRIHWFDWIESVPKT